jgi:4-aminobutyrate aminotransferase-like enzyme
MLVNSGSEANDLAWRMATAVTGNRGGLCTAHAYHGITEAIAALSPEGWFGAPGPDHVETWEPRSALAPAIERLGERGYAPAATILDGVVTSDGIFDLEPAYVQELVRLTREAGGLWIADEVQSGHGRTGDALWSFERVGIVPDFVTLGKPMGNGHPVAAVITRSEIVSQLVGRTSLFSTFGGNPVSAAAALAVLDVIDDERVLERVQRTGRALRDALLAIDHPEIAAVRGVGLVWGVELTTDARARAVRDEMRRLGVLVGTTGPRGNVLKIRPPLALDETHVSQLVDALRRALTKGATDV